MTSAVNAAHERLKCQITNAMCKCQCERGDCDTCQWLCVALDEIDTLCLPDKFPPGPWTKFRGDGWPLCPRCDEDELFSISVPASVSQIAGCHRCHWRTELGLKHAKTAPVPELGQ